MTVSADLAQLVEQRTRNAEVTGSKPAIGMVRSIKVEKALCQL